MIVLACLALNIAAFFYLHAWRPIVDFVRAVRQMRMIRAFRIAGLLLLLLAVNVMPVHAQKVVIDSSHKIWCKNPNDMKCMNASRKQAINEKKLKQYLALEAQTHAAENKALFDAQYYSDGDYYLLKHQQPQDTTGWTTLDNVLRYVWENSGRLTLIFAILTFCYLMIGKLEGSGETYGDVMRQEAAERWAEEQGDDIHNPFDSPEGMQPASQYVPVRTRR